MLNHYIYTYLSTHTIAVCVCILTNVFGCIYFEREEKTARDICARSIFIYAFIQAEAADARSLGWSLTSELAII
jgi:hypothetical protein